MDNLKTPISFYIVAKDEIYWIEPCILSIANIADEIIFVDNGSTDKTVLKVEQLKSKHNLNLKIFKEPKIIDLADLRNFAISKCSNAFIFVWDADFVAFEDTSPHSLQKQLLYLEKNKAFDRYHRFMCKTPVMRVLLNQTWKTSHIHPLNCAMFHKDYLEKVVVSNTHGWDERIWKKGCKTFEMAGYYFISVDVKSDLHFVYRVHRSKWRLFRRKMHLNLDHLSYLKEVLHKDASDLIKELYSKKLIQFPYDVPLILKNYVKNPPYHLIFRDNKIIGRRFDYERLNKLEIG